MLSCVAIVVIFLSLLFITNFFIPWILIHAAIFSSKIQENAPEILFQEAPHSESVTVYVMVKRQYLDSKGVYTSMMQM